LTETAPPPHTSDPPWSESSGAAALLSAVVASAAEGIVVQDADGRVVLANPSAERILGVRAGELAGLPALDSSVVFAHEDGAVVPPAELPAAVTLRTGLPQTDIVLSVRAGDRLPIWLSINTSPLILPGRSRPEAVVVSFFEITGRVQADAALRASEARFRRLLEAAPDGIVTVDRDGRIVLANAQAEQLFGYRPGELTGQLIDRLLPEHPRAHDRAVPVPTAELRNRPLGSGTDLTGRRKDGSEFPAAVSLSPMESEGGSLVIAVVRDVSRERELDRLKDDFVATVSHELRTPLTSIVGFADLLLAGDGGVLSETARRYLEIIVGNSERLMAIINDLLDVSRLEAGQLVLEPKPLDLAATVRTVTTGFAPQLTAKEQTLRLHLPDDLPPVWADPTRVAQILANLVSNAHKYTPAGGAIAVVVRRKAEMLHVSVVDSGIGLSVEERTRLFTKFYRVDKLASRQAGGTGLGLAITRALVELHGGTVGVESTPGTGSTFSFTLPLATGKGRQSSDPATKEPGLRRDLVPKDTSVSAG
jgi:protein-histidine pros-kinase